MMDTKQDEVAFPDVQAAIYRLALSLDSFLVNGIQYGIIPRAAPTDFLQKTASTLLNDVANLEAFISHASVISQPKIREMLGELTSCSQRRIDVVAELGSFRTLLLQELRFTIRKIPLLREECVQLIQQLEKAFCVPKPFYQTRPGHSTAAVNEFLANLEPVFVKEWAAANEVDTEPI